MKAKTRTDESKLNKIKVVVETPEGLEAQKEKIGGGGRLQRERNDLVAASLSVRGDSDA